MKQIMRLFLLLSLLVIAPKAISTNEDFSDDSINIVDAANEHLCAECLADLKIIDDASEKKRSCGACCPCVRCLNVKGPLTVSGQIFANGGIIDTGAFTVNGVDLSTPAAIAASLAAAGATVPIAAAQYVQLGAQPGSIAAGQPFTFTTAVITTPLVTSQVALGGTIFTLGPIGFYEVNYQSYIPTDGGIVLYQGATLVTTLPMPYTMIGKTSSGQMSGSVIIQTTTANSFLSMNAAAGNAAAIQPGPNSSTTNQNATTISIKYLG